MAILSYFTRFTWRGRMPAAGNYGLEKEQILETYSAQLQKSWNSTKVIFGNNKKYWAEEVHQMGPHLATRVGARPTPWARPLPRGPPAGPPMAIFCYMESFDEEKNNQKPSFRTRLRRHEAEPWRNQSRALAERFCRGNFPPGEGNHRHHHHQQLSHLGEGYLHRHLQYHHLLSNPSSSLVSNSCLYVWDWYL